MEKRVNISANVLRELTNFDNFKIEGIGGSYYSPHAASAAAQVLLSQQYITKEPFISFLRVCEVLGDGNERERIFLVCRNYTPMGIDPIDDSGMFINRNAPLGTVASYDVGDEVIVSFQYQGDRIRKRFFLLEKGIFTPIKKGDWDAINSSLYYDFEEEFFPSLRDLLSSSGLDEAGFAEIGLTQDVDESILNDFEARGRKLIEDLNRAESTRDKKRMNKALRRQSRQRAIVESIQLKDQPILDKFQNTFCRLPLASQILLTGSPGTGKTTTLIKRIAFKSDPEHLTTSDDVVIDDNRIKSWLMFTPNDLLKIYLKEAMNKEGLSATDGNIATWEKERTTLGRDVLKFLKTKNSGVFGRTHRETLKNSSSANVTALTKQFTQHFANSVLNEFCSKVDDLQRGSSTLLQLQSDSAWLARRLRKFADNCLRLKTLLENREELDSDSKIVWLISDFAPYVSQLAGIRRDTTSEINSIIDNLILKHPALIDDVSKIILDERTTSFQKENQSLDRLPDDLQEENLLTDPEENDEDEDIRVKARKQIRLTYIRYAESLAFGTSIKSELHRRTWSAMDHLIEDLESLRFFGLMNSELKKVSFRHLDYDRIFKEISSRYAKFRNSLITSGESAYFKKDSMDDLNAGKISVSEIDLLIYAMLKFANKIFKIQPGFLKKLTKFDILENIKSQYRTQVAVDEASDFSAVQLGCMYFLADPAYQSVSFAGDLMQRVTHHGISNWNECEFVSPNLIEKELVISYRQTPALLGIAGKLYENIIGESAPFRSKNKDSEQYPRPLRFQTESDDLLGDWLTQRIHEIYEINESKLPSIAIFVPQESDIDSAFDLMHEKLNEFSIDIEKCKEGKVLGTGSFIRIFSVDYIKGLEFEGVFFLGIDEIYDKAPDLIDKYLYVGLTRATTFLGVTYRTQFPEKIDFIKESFAEADWQEFLR